MNTSQLSKYAPAARKAFIAAVGAQAARLGITAKGVTDAQMQGDVLIVGGQAFPKTLAEPRKVLVERVQTHGFDATLEAIAYTWFNRFVAIRYMELHGYLDHGYRVLSHPEGQNRPEILDHVADVELPGLDHARAVELKLDGTQDEELYRLLLKAQCNALHQAMPFLFERIGDETELLLPANLLHTDSLIRQLVEEIDESAWQEIEIIGWLYQFYISEKKDQVIGKVVKSEDIPAATQLFTPNWIVKYMVQNSLGAQWMATYPQSLLKEQMDYYIEPAEQTDEVKAQLATITPGTLNPEELTLIDPACGSGHILVEAYELFKAIYLERGYRQRDVARLILEKNLFGLDIDERAAQLTGFALMMKGRADDRRFFEWGVKLNVMALVDSTGFDAERLAQGVRLADYGLQASDLTELKRLFEHATTFGSLIQVPEGLAAKLPALKQLCEATSHDLFVSDALKRLGPLEQQAEMLAATYDVVVANPPYMGSKGMNGLVKEFLKDHYKGYEKDVFSAFIDRNLEFSNPNGRLGFMSPFVWMFISSHEHLRTRLIDKETITSLVQLEYSGFEGATVPICTFTLQKRHVNGERGCYVRLSEFRGSDNQGPKTLEAIRDRDCGWFFEAAQDEFKKIPGSPVAYWVGDPVLDIFSNCESLSKTLEPRQGLATADNDSFLRLWAEVSYEKIGLGFATNSDANESGKKWFPIDKGGEFRRWYGNQTHLVNWKSGGRQLKAFERSVIRNEANYFLDGVTWTAISSSLLSVRRTGPGNIFSNAGMKVFAEKPDRLLLGNGFLNSAVCRFLVSCLSQTLNFDQGIIAHLPLKKDFSHSDVVVELEATSKTDWDAYEHSWDFRSFPLLTASSESTPILESSYTTWITQNRNTIAEMKRLEEENNRLFIDAYGLADELTPDVPIEQITLTVNPAYRYGGKLIEEEQWTRFRQDTMEEVVSYAVGCMMGRYSLDEPGLIYAHSGNEGFDPSRYATFPADADGIVPFTDTEWFDDDAVHRLIEFISVTWDATHLENNLTFLADDLSPKKNESSRETLRSYLCDRFFKDHLQTYRNRPIYWLFSSGKQKAFQCLVYLHRYNEGTLSRMRSEYVIPLQGKMAARLERLQGDIQVATSTAHQKRLEKERSKLEKQQVELLAFDEKLRHYADMRITLDLDDGVKVNYGKFGDLLAEVKAVHGQKAEEA
jgi:type II restriction/modification system DNA methylase subunit YeeA